MTKSQSESPNLREAYALARNLVRLQPDGLRGRSGHRLCWVKGASFGMTLLAASPLDRVGDGGVATGFAIVGRHGQCDVVIPDSDMIVALRHLLVRSIATSASATGVALRILDLHTDQGFVLPDGTTQTSVLAEGPVAVAIGRFAIVALPSETHEDALPNDLPAAQVHTPPAMRDQIAALDQALLGVGGPYRMNARPNRHSHITLMPRLVMIGEPIPPRVGRLATGGTWGITLERGGRTATLTVSDADLTGGVLIGRSEKCISEALRRITDNSTSRVHVLVLREGEQIFAYDLASTHGTFIDKMPIRRSLLADRGTLLVLGRDPQSVRMYWHRVVTS